MASVAIIGAGNLGAFLAAHLLRAGHSAFFCVRRPVAGLRVDSLGPVDAPAYQDHPPSADIVLLTVKAYDTPAALAWLPRLCARGAPVAVIQNGVHHAERVAPFPAIPVLSYVYVEAREGVHYAFAPPREHFTVPAGPDAAPFRRLFSHTSIGVREQSDFLTAAWHKMLHNCVSNPLTALAGRGLEILAEPFYLDWASRILAEALPIARADGADLNSADAAEVLRILASYPPGTRTSMLQDRERGRPLEIDALNGALVLLGRRYGLPVSVNEELVARLRAESDNFESSGGTNSCR